MSQERHTRGYIPHIEAGQSPQFVTWRLKDSLSAAFYTRWKEELSDLPEDLFKRELHKKVEDHLDKGAGSQILRNPVAAISVQDSLIFGHGDWYHLHAWCVMPTHVHCLLSPFEGRTLSTILKSLKGFTSRQIGKKLNCPGRLWQEESFDVLVTSERQFYSTVKYIEWNPVKAGLCVDPKEWVYSSANPISLEKLAGSKK